MHPLSTWKFIARRLRDDWKLLASVLFGITIATGLIAGGPIYVDALERQGLHTAIERSSSSFLDIFVYGPHIPLDRTSLEEIDQAVDASTQRHLSKTVRGWERDLKSPNYLVGIPRQPLSFEPGARVSRGYFQSLTNLQHHVTFRAGRMSTDRVSQGSRGPVIEAVVPTALAEVFDISPGDVVRFTPSLANRTLVEAHIVGIFDASAPTEEYWRHSFRILLDPEPIEDAPDEDVEVNPDESPLALFITKEAMVEAVGKAYPGTLARSNWFLYVDKEQLKNWSITESRTRIQALELDLSQVMAGATVFTGIKKLMSDIERRSFFSTVPLLLLLTIMVMTVLYYLAMMVSYLVQSRESDVALLRSRGVSTLQLLRLYALEGLVLTIVAVALAPFLAMGAVAVAGKLPYFQEITGGGYLPVRFNWTPFLAAAGSGLLSLAIFVVPGVVGARTGLVIHKLRSSRPPTQPFFQRYFLDIGLLVLGGVIFWELHERGQLVSGGLFQEVEVNEALLFAPVLFLTVVALAFMRLFPLFVRFISGESAELLDLIVAATLVVLASAIAIRDVIDGNGLEWLPSVALLVVLAVAYWGTRRAEHRWSRFGGLGLQAALVASISMMEPPATDEITFVPTISLILIVPAQVLFLLFKAYAQMAPVWVSVGLWHMARNPLQFGWLVLLLVMVTGLGVLATTVGGTLDRSYEDRINYDVGADLRVSGIPGFMSQGRKYLKELYLTIPGVTSASLAYRGNGSAGTTPFGRGFQILGVESQEFPYVSPWYRSDFSTQPLSGIMRALQSNDRFEAVLIPGGATQIGVWVNPEDEYPNMFLRMAIEDARGVVRTITFGELGDPKWHLMRTEIPAELEPPLQLVSVQIYEPVFGPAGTPGSILFDNIHVTTGTDGEEQVIESFDRGIRWSSLATSMLADDQLVATTKDVQHGERAGTFHFGKDTDRGVRGFYHSPSGGPLPIVASASFLSNTGAEIGDVLILTLEGRMIPVLIRDKVNYFPTMDPPGRRYILADLDILLRHLNIVSPTLPIAPNELFIAEASGAGEAVIDAVFTLVGRSPVVHDREAQLESIRLDPLISAGWKAMVVLSLGIIVFITALGYLTYLLSFADRRRTEMGFLHSLGVSRQQMAGLLSLEHLVIVAVGLALGTWAGFQMSAIMVSSVAVTETGAPIVPPFRLTTDWGPMLLVYALLIGIFVAALYRLTRTLFNLNLYAISRVEGY